MEKKKYIKPRIERIPLDNEISLALTSAPPEGPGELGLLIPQDTYTNPIKTDIV
jgi:hypothetical protein